MESSDLYGMLNHAHAFHIKQLNREYITLDTVELNGTDPVHFQNPTTFMSIKVFDFKALKQA